MNDMSDQELAKRLIATIDSSLKKWKAWFPDPQSGVEVSRDELLALKKYAEIGLQVNCCTNCRRPLDGNLCDRCGLVFSGVNP